MARIEVSHEELIAQSACLAALQADYDALFSSTGALLKSVNGNWSENLSNNYSGKIASVQKGFAGIVDMLGAGADAARTSAESFESIDRTLAKTIQGEVEAAAGQDGMTAVQKAQVYQAGGGGFASVGGGQGAFGSRQDGRQETLLDQFSIDRLRKEMPESWNTKSLIEYAEKQFDKLPDQMKDYIEDAVGKNTSAAVDITADILKGEAGLETFHKFMDAIGSSDSPKASAFGKTVNMVLKREGNFGELLRGQEYYQQRAQDLFLKGDYSEGLLELGKSVGVGLMGIGYGTLDVATELMADAGDLAADIAIKSLHLPEGVTSALTSFGKGITTRLLRDIL